jgi:aminoglycoside phosphotransferase (APT) family kinase protein
LPEEIQASGLESPSSDTAWIHVDPHLDNVLWRVDDSPVLIDWSNARIGPPEVDLAAMMMGYAFRTDAPISPEELIRTYADRTAGSVDLITRSVVHALKPAYIQGSMGWVGEESNAGFPDRKERLRDETALRLVRALDWVDRTAEV